MKEITCKDLYELIRCNNLNIIDVRLPSDYIRGHIKSSYNIQYNKLFKDYSTILSKQNVYYIICDTGSISKQLALHLENNGYTVINVLGGYANWNYSLTR